MTAGLGPETLGALAEEAPLGRNGRPEDVAQDEEGLQTMRQLARNLLWLLQCIAAGDAAGVPRPETEARKFTNFIR